MSTYQNPLQVSNDDPLCSSTALGNTIIGILFEKTGKDIKEAVQARISSIDGKILEYDGVIGKIEGFIEEKKKIIKELEDYDTDRDDEKDALLKPLNEQLEDLRKQYHVKHAEISTLITQRTSVFDKETLAEVSKKAVVFEESFDAFKGTMKDVEEFMKKEEKVLKDNPQLSYTGCQGSTGSMGTTGTSGGLVTYNNTDNTGVSWSTTTSNIGIGDTPGATIDIYNPTPEDKAYCRIQTLKTLLRDYEKKIEILRRKIKELKEEMRRLALIHRNIEDGRAYKLDLNKLSAFGFEDVEIKE